MNRIVKEGDDEYQPQWGGLQFILVTSSSLFPQGTDPLESQKI